jgi:hypothetical protein
MTDRYPNDLHELRDLLTNCRGIKVELKEHPIYREFRESPIVYPVEVVEMAGRQQIIVRSGRGDVSVIRGAATSGMFELYHAIGQEPWTEEFSTAKEAATRIMELVDPPFPLWSETFLLAFGLAMSAAMFLPSASNAPPGGRWFTFSCGAVLAAMSALSIFHAIQARRAVRRREESKP